MLSPSAEPHVVLTNDCPVCGRQLRDTGFLKGSGRFVWTVRVLNCVAHGEFFLSRHGLGRDGGDAIPPAS